MEFLFDEEEESYRIVYIIQECGSKVIREEYKIQINLIYISTFIYLFEK